MASGLRFKFHLSSALIAVLSCAVYFWISFSWVTIYVEVSPNSPEIPRAFHEEHGWPFAYYVTTDEEYGYGFEYNKARKYRISDKEIRELYPQFSDQLSTREEWYYARIVPNVLLGILLMFGVLALIEWLAFKRRSRLRLN